MMMIMMNSSLNHERLAATALLLDIRIPKNKPLIQFILHPIHLAAYDAKQRFTVYKHLDSILLDRLIERTRLLHILQMVRQARAAPVLDPYPYHLRLWLVEQIAQLMGR